MLITYVGVSLSGRKVRPYGTAHIMSPVRILCLTMTMKSIILIAVVTATTAAAFSPGRKHSLMPIISSSRAAGKTVEAILFDCDGVLADTERDGHRLAFNRAFQLNGIEEDWSEHRYGKLLEVGGGKVRHRNDI